MKHRRKYAAKEAPRVPSNWIACQACKGSGKRHENGERMLPYRPCRACLGAGSLNPSVSVVATERTGEREAGAPFDPHAPGRVPLS